VSFSCEIFSEENDTKLIRIIAGNDIDAQYIWDGKRLFLGAEINENFRAGFGRENIHGNTVGDSKLQFSSIENSVNMKIKARDLRNFE